VVEALAELVAATLAHERLWKIERERSRRATVLEGLLPIYGASRRAGRPFVDVNCAALPETSGPPSRTASSARTSTTGFTSSRSGCRRCAIAGRTSCRCPRSSWPRSGAPSAGRPPASPATPERVCSVPLDGQRSDPSERAGPVARISSPATDGPRRGQRSLPARHFHSRISGRSSPLSPMCSRCSMSFSRSACFV
jgi:hypothetical protein